MQKNNPLDVFIFDMESTRKILIRESQYNKLFEGYQEGFSLKELNKIESPEDKYYYCLRWLGEPIGNGSSRFVFILNDSLVLKLESHYDPEQNKSEAMRWEECRSPLFAKIYAAANDYSWLVSERVNVAKAEDFEMVVGIPYVNVWRQTTKKIPNIFSKYGGDETIGFDKYFNGEHTYEEKYNGLDIMQLIEYMCEKHIFDYVEASYTPDEIKEFNGVIASNSWLTELDKLVEKYQLYDFQIKNFGLVNRDGNPQIILLDSAL